MSHERYFRNVANDVFPALTVSGQVLALQPREQQTERSQTTGTKLSNHSRFRNTYWMESLQVNGILRQLRTPACRSQRREV